ncbi:MAG TPA: hypothetical protein VEV41_00590 [Terriglobales bacterium]|nr:hypothetical protein [Terriglobales bacterium]
MDPRQFENRFFSIGVTSSADRAQLVLVKLRRCLEDVLLRERIRIPKLVEKEAPDLKGLKGICGVLSFTMCMIFPAAPQNARVYREAGTWIEEVKGTLPAVKILDVNMDAGSISVRSEVQPSIIYTIQERAGVSTEREARRLFAKQHARHSIHGDTASLTLVGSAGDPGELDADFSLIIPRGTSAVKLTTRRGSISVKGVLGGVEARSGGGRIRLDDIGGVVVAETAGEGIEVGEVGADLTLHTGGGNIYVRSAKGKIKASSGGGNVTVLSCPEGGALETSAGNIDVKHCRGELSAVTGGGSIDLGDVMRAQIRSRGGHIRVGSATGFVQIETRCGGVELADVSEGVKAETGEGSIEARFVNRGHSLSNSALETSAGDIVVYLPAGLAITIRAKIEVANGHKIYSEFSEIGAQTKGGEYSPQTISVEGVLSGGGPVLELHTMSGNIYLHRASR